MDFTFDFNRTTMYTPSDYNYQLKDKINELESYKEETQMNHQISLVNTSRIVEHIQFHKEILNRHNEYYGNIYKKIDEVENSIEQLKIDYGHTLIDIKTNIVKITNYIEDTKISKFQNIIQKQKDQEKQILELQEIIQKQKDQEKQILELQEIIQKQKDQEKQILELKEIIQEKSKKRNFDDITNDYIDRLTLTKKRSKPWSKGMSKYISITIVNDVWRWESSIFDENHINFKLKEDAEKHFETIIAKYNIDPIHITRIGYENK